MRVREGSRRFNAEPHAPSVPCPISHIAQPEVKGTILMAEDEKIVLPVALIHHTKPDNTQHRNFSFVPPSTQPLFPVTSTPPTTLSTSCNTAMMRAQGKRETQPPGPPPPADSNEDIVMGGTSGNAPPILRLRRSPSRRDEPKRKRPSRPNEPQRPRKVQDRR